MLENTISKLKYLTQNSICIAFDLVLIVLVRRALFHVKFELKIITTLVDSLGLKFIKVQFSL